MCALARAYVITHAQNFDIIWVILKKQVAILEKNWLRTCPGHRSCVKYNNLNQ